MKRHALPFVLGCLAGCGGPASAPETMSDAQMVQATTAELQAEDTRWVIVAGLDEIRVPPDVFGTTTPVVGRFAFAVAKDGAGHVRGRYRFSESVDGVTTHYSGPLTCLGIYDFNGLTGNRAKVGGRIDASDDPTLPAGGFIWWQAIDNRPLHRPDQSTLAGFGNEAANEAFCASSNPPRFGPFDVVLGNITVGADDD
jgi:hypothetical protein